MLYLTLYVYIHSVTKYAIYIAIKYASGLMNMERARNVHAASPTQRLLHVFCGVSRNLVFLASL